ncbi:MAG: hypothetical protein ACLFU8_16570 [Anaerolineales bacterium]
MHRERWMGLLVLAILLLMGFFWGRQQMQRAPAEAPDGFRGWFWQQRGLDLLAQVALIFAGATGVAAILPGQREEESDLCTWF